MMGSLRKDPRGAEPLILSLLTRPEAQVRFWAGAMGAEILDKRFVPQLVRLMGDRSPEVRSLAIQELRRLDLKALRPHLARFRQRLHTTKDEMYVRQYLFLLAQLDDREAIPDIRAFADRPGRWIANKRLADVIIAYLETGPNEIVRRIDEHDHEHMFPLTLAAQKLMKRSEAIAVLQRCVSATPDEECRGDCERALRALTSPGDIDQG
jgi:HEAT repeat protein